MAIKSITSAGTILEALCRDQNKFGMFISFLPVSFAGETEEVYKAAPYLDLQVEPSLIPHGEQVQILCNGEGYLLFDTEEEMQALYAVTVGDDGPTKFNPYTGTERVYALTCSPTAGLLTENT